MRCAFTGFVCAALLLAGFSFSAHADVVGKDEKPLTHIIEIKQFQFFPEVLTVRSGDRVKWVNMDVVPHTATATDDTWDTGNLEFGEHWAFTASAFGETEYICTYHPAMEGKIIVVR